MTITRAQTESILIGRRKAQMSVVSFDVLTMDGTNTDLNDPIASAIRELGGVVANPALVTDVDIASVVTDPLLTKYLDLATLFLIISIRGNLAVVDFTAGPFSEKLSQLAKQLLDDIKYFKDIYLVDIPEAQAGMITLNLSTHGDDTQQDDTGLDD